MTRYQSDLYDCYTYTEHILPATLKTEPGVMDWNMYPALSG